MIATYSAFFSSGLLAPRVVRCTTPVLPSSPMAIAASPVDPVDRHMNSTAEPISPRPRAQEASRNAERPRMRRRRSSINVGANPLALIKSPVRNAGAALQRTGLMSPTRHRAASIGINEALENNSLLGRLRSGSVGGVPNPPRRVRREMRRPNPLAPPPSAPLPALPTSPTACGSSLLPPAMLVPMSREPLAVRCSGPDNVGNLFSPVLPSPTLLSPDYASKISFRLSPGFPSSSENAIDEAMMEE